MRTNLPELFRSFAIPAYRFATPSKSFRIPSLALFHSFFRSPELPEYFCTLKFHFGFLFCHRCLIFKVLSPPLSRSGLPILSNSLPFVNTFFKKISKFLRFFLEAFFTHYILSSASLLYTIFLLTDRYIILCFAATYSQKQKNKRGISKCITKNPHLPGLRSHGRFS